MTDKTVCAELMLANGAGEEATIIALFLSTSIRYAPLRGVGVMIIEEPLGHNEID